MYPWFHLHHPGYPPAPPPPPPATGPSMFAEAANNAAGGVARQHHVYLHGMERYGRGFGYRRGPSRLKWVSFRVICRPAQDRVLTTKLLVNDEFLQFFLGALAATVYLNHRRQKLRYGEEDTCDPRRYFFACRQRRDDLPTASGHPMPNDKATQHASGSDRSSLQDAEERDWRNRWHNRWRASEKVPTMSPAINVTGSGVSSNTSHAPAGAGNRPSGSVDSISNETKSSESASMLTYDNALLSGERPPKEPTQRDRMETEVSGCDRWFIVRISDDMCLPQAIAFAEEKIDLLVSMLEGLKTVSLCFRQSTLL